MDKYPFRVTVTYRYGAERRQQQHNFETLARAMLFKIGKATEPNTIQIEVSCILEVYNPPAVPQHHHNGSHRGMNQ